jgi:outer membrane protein assembly factor BamB
VFSAKFRLALALVLLGAAAAPADDWPQWRGPNRAGAWAETGILETFPADGLRVLWRADVGPGWSSPVVAGGRVYLTDSQLDRPRAKERVLCFDAANGKLLWSHSYDAAYPDWAFTEPGRGPTATPLVEDGRVYALGNKGDLSCLDAVKGEVLWKRNLEKDYEVQEFAFNASPLVEGDLLIACIGSYPGTNPSSVLALDKKTGKEVWKTPTDGLTNSSPVVISAGGKRQLIVWTQGSVTSLDPANGKAWWQEKTKAEASAAIATPLFSKGLLLVGGLMLKLDADKPAATVLWPDAKGRRVLSNTSTPLLLGDHVYSARSTGELVCLEAATGKQVWETEKVTGLRGGASIHLTPNGDAVFLHTDRGDLIRARLTPGGYEESSRARLLAPVGEAKAWPPPAYAGRCAFARNDRELVCVSLAAKP